jgi:large subunit ribosomal protein L28
VLFAGPGSGEKARRTGSKVRAANFDDILEGIVFFGEDMAQVCDICGKGPQFGNNISHAHNITKRRWNVNLHPVKAKVGGGAKRLRVCSSCLKAGKVVKA